MKDWAFVEHVTQQLQRPRPGDSKHPTLWPSEASALYTNEYGEEKVVGKCRRAIFFRYLIDSYKFYDKYKVWKPLVERLQRESKPVDKYMLWIWAAGELYEEYLIRKAKESGVFVNEQVPVYVKSHNVSGKKDIEVFNPHTQKLSIVEAKSVYGFGANVVLGTPAQRAKGRMGEPRDSNLMQIAIYHWWSASLDDAYEESRLVYGARDTGRYAEYLVRTVEEDGVIYIEWRPYYPSQGKWQRSHITINSILDQYQYVQQCVDGGRIPKRDFDVKYSDEQLQTMYDRDEFGKTDREKYEKILIRNAENAALQRIIDADDENVIAVAAEEIDVLPAPTRRAVDKFYSVLGEDDEKNLIKAQERTIKALRKVKLKQQLLPIEKGDWQCNYCKFAPICYNKNGEPQDIK